jgi:hypothetical protein
MIHFPGFHTASKTPILGVHCLHLIKRNFQHSLHSLLKPKCSQAWT